MDTRGLETLLAVVLVAAIAPVLVAAVPRLRIPQVVVLILAGILIGPHGLGLADTSWRPARSASCSRSSRSRCSLPTAVSSPRSCPC